jgi:hypothetical protein
MSTAITRDDTCKGFPGVVSTAILSKPDSREDVSLKVVACSTLRDGRGYFFAYFVPEFNAEKQEPELKKIVDATDIFELPEPVANDYARPDAVDQPRERTVFSAQGASPAFGSPNYAPRRVYPNGGGETWTGLGPRPAITPRPMAVRPTALPPPARTTAPLQFNPNGSVEFAGKPQDAERERRTRANRQRVPW